jgi:hypothetical protein
MLRARRPYGPRAFPPAFPQRLVAENLEQQRVLEGLVARLGDVERALQALHEQRESRSRWGGFIGPRGL